jgi:hypothetical protein
MAAADSPELSPFDYEGFRFAHERMRALAAAGDPRNEMPNVRGVIDGIVENYAGAVVHHRSPDNALVVNAQNAAIFTHALATYDIGGAFTSVRFVFDADFPGHELRSGVWDINRFPKLQIVVAEDTAAGGPVRDDDDARAAAWRNGPLALVGAPGSRVRQFRVKRCRTRAVYADIARAVRAAHESPAHALHSLYIQRLSDADPRAVTQIVHAVLYPPPQNRGRTLRLVHLPLVGTLRAYPGGRGGGGAVRAPTVRIQTLVLVPPTPARGGGGDAGTRDLGVPGPTAWEWLAAGPGIAAIHAPDLSSLDATEWAAVTDWRRARAEHLLPPPPPVRRTTGLPPAPDGMLVLVHRVAPATAPHYARRSVVGQTARHLRVIVQNDGRVGDIERTVGGGYVPRNPHRHAVDPTATYVGTGDARANPLWWDEIDDQARCYRDAVDANDIRSFGGMVVLTRLHGRDGPDGLRDLLVRFLRAMWPALWPRFARHRPVVPIDADAMEVDDDEGYHYRARFLLDGSRIRPESAETERPGPLHRRVAFDRALNVILREFKIANPTSGPVGAMHDATMALWDAGDIHFVAPGERSLSAEERNAYLGIP